MPSIVASAAELDPPSLVTAIRIVVCPMHHSTPVIPDVFPPERNRISLANRYTGCEIDVVHDEYGKIFAGTDEKPLMPRAFCIVGEKSRDSAMDVYLDTFGMIPGCSAQ